MRWINRLAGTLTLLAVIAVPPLAAGAWLLNHPWQPPTRGQWQTWAQQPLTAGTIIAGCLTVAALGWSLFVYLAARRAVADLRRHLRRVRQLPLPSPAQMTAGSLAGVAALTMPAAVVTHPAPAVAADTTHPAGQAETGRDTYNQPAADPAGINLPGGGWIPYRTAGAVAALSTLAWLQRRRRYRPDPHHPRDHRNDPDLPPDPHIVDAIAAALTAAEPAGDTAAPAPADWPPEGVLYLTGPGAAAAARGLLVTAAVTAATSGGLTPPITAPAEDLKTLLPGIDAAELASLDHGTTTTADPCRSNADDHDSRQTDTWQQPDLPSRPAIITLSVGSDRTATHHWHVSIDGITTGTGLEHPRRLCLLDPAATADLLKLAHGNSTPTATRMPPPADPDVETSPASPRRDIPAAPAHLSLLGGCRLTVAGNPVNVNRSAGLQILAYLAVHPDGATRAELTHTVWPDLPAAPIAQRFHTTLAGLRKQLRPLLGDDPITRHDDRYHLNPHAITTDLQPWRTAVHAMTHAAGTLIRQHSCRAVAQSYNGELAAGQTWPWLTAHREQIRRTLIDACTTLAEDTQPHEALAWLQHAIDIDPYNEALHHQAADLLNTTGDHSGAAALMQNLRHRLETDARSRA